MKKLETVILTKEDASAFMANNMSISFNGFECDINETIWAVDTAEESVYFTDVREATKYYIDLVDDLKENISDRSVFITISKIRLSFCEDIDIENLNASKLADIFYSHVDDDVEPLAEVICVNRNVKEIIYNC